MALAIVVVGALWAGLPAGTLAVIALIAACPLMMFFMMRGMHTSSGADQHPSPPQLPDRRDQDTLR